MKFMRNMMFASLVGVVATATPVLASGHQGSHRHHHGHMAMSGHSRYGGPTYTGAPALDATASLIEAGGGADSYSTATALTSMVGADLVQAEVGKLTAQYSKDRVDSWLKVFDFAVNDSIKIATKAGVSLPMGTLKGKELASALVMAGLGKNHVFYVEYMLDKAVTHGIHTQVMDDIDKEFSPTADADYHRITNQAMYDLAQALGAKSVKLNPFH